MLRKWICLWCVLTVVMVAAGTGKGAEMTGTIRIIPQWCGTAVAGGRISLQNVGTVDGEKIYLTDGLANWSVEAEELKSGSWIRWISEKSDGKMIVGRAGEEGGAVFTDLEPGVYLVRQLETEGAFFPFSPFFLTVPEGKSWDICRRPKMIRNDEAPETGDRPAPIIAAMGLGFSVAVLMVLADERKK